MSEFIPVNTPLLNGNEKKYLNQCIDTGWISSEGPFVQEFEKKFANKVDRAYGIAVSNGTAAIDLAIEALEIKAGDEVIMPAFTIISCINQIIRIGAVPVLVDSDPHTWNMNVQQIEKKITPRTKLIMIVHIYGLPVDIDPVLELAKKYSLKVLEDAAEMHGQEYKNLPCGSFGDISTFSFYSNKNITTGEGGMVVTNSPELDEKCRSIRNLCFKQDKRFVHDRLGWNLRMTNIQAAIGLAQLERLDEFVKIKREMGAKYTALLKDLEGYIELPLEKTSYAQSIYWVYGVLIKKNCALTPEGVMVELAKRGIGSRPFFYPMHMQPVLKNRGLFDGESYPVAENLYNKGFYVPSGLALKLSEIERVSSELRDIFLANAR
ncbi:DegT/DnrJ/EryC1/StrS aminotransferase family protein [Polynucleobacter sp. MWH-Berg-3C6]|uniref:DegT/DnrJ/EryC1/StrS family aminotransferase n=1 Tax=Polynucleobacter sp. MWH-Berg-3C6 TaxID=1855882 RepID=UPI001C0B454F|nr:DegT/DnrJ/EryC1/StrS family aminotransferase [Polynucleobacter sp. MWH-Berg-3C6]MBU3549896.1 DegT/DnrJ/EryC1/StrS family aminotransferase [Polynucleobacter sp. MWH-Berg-3C6]